MAGKPLSVAGFPVSLPLAVDLALSPDGDLLVGPDGDLEFVTGPEALMQTVVFRLKTRLGDALYAPACGASLDQLFGLPNAPATAARAEQQVLYALTHDGLLSPDALTITVYPEDENTLTIHVAIDAGDFFGSTGGLLTTQVSVDLLEGLIL